MFYESKKHIKKTHPYTTPIFWVGGSRDRHHMHHFPLFSSIPPYPPLLIYAMRERLKIFQKIKLRNGLIDPGAFSGSSKQN